MAKILVVDDDSSIRHVLREILESAGHRVWEASDGDRAAHVAVSQSFDLVIMDLIMHRTSGTQAAREIFADKPGQRIVFMSGIVSLSVGELREMTRELGVRCFLTKPFQIRTVLDAVEQALAP